MGCPLLYGRMPTQTHQTAVVLIPPADTWPSIQAIRKHHDRHFRRWMPRITLLYPFRPADEFDTVVEPLSQACQSLHPFSLTLSHIRFFRHRRDSFTVGLGPDSTEACTHLQGQLAQVVPDCNDVGQYPNGFTPHLSVGQVRKRARLQSLLNDLQQTWQPLSFTVQEVSLIQRGAPPDDIFRVAHRIPLGG